MNPKFLWWLVTELLGLAKQLPSNSQHPILIVEDSDTDAEMIEDACKVYEAKVVKVETIGLAKQQLARQKFRLVFVDHSLHDGSGLNLIDFITVKYPGLPVTIITGSQVRMVQPDGTETALWSGRDWSIICKGTHSENFIQAIGTSILKSNGVNGHKTSPRVVLSTWIFFVVTLTMGIFWRETILALINWWAENNK